MSSFGAKGLTNKGRVLQAKAQAGVQLIYIKYILGDGQLGGQSIGTLINVISPKKTVDVTRLKMTPPDQATVGFVLSNQDVTTGFYFREIGLYAMDPDEGEILYWYGNAGDTADYIPPTNTGDVVNKTIDTKVYVGTASNVTLTIDQNLAYVTHDELDEAIAGVKVEVPPASLTQAGIVQLSNATDGTRENVAPTEKALGEVMKEAQAGKQAGIDRKAEVVAALNSIGVQASTSETWAELIPKISAVIRATGNATAADVLAGKTASNQNGPITGTMPNRGAVTITPSTIDQVIIGGYHNGAGVVKGDTDLKPNNLPKDINIFNVQGVLERLTTAEKKDIADAITSNGVAASENDSNAELANKIGQIPLGKKNATGTITSGGFEFFPNYSGTGVQSPYVSFNFANLPFIPSVIEFTRSDRSSRNIGSVWRRTDYYSKGSEYANSSGGSGNAYRVPYSNSVVKIPVDANSVSFDWTAYE